MKFRTLILCSALATVNSLSPASLTAHAATMVRGENRTCRDFTDLDFALDHPSSDYFKNWTGRDFDDARAWVTACTEAPPSARDETRQSLLAERREHLAASGETARNERTQAATREAEVRNQEADEAAARDEIVRQNTAAVAARKAKADSEAKQAAFVECSRSPAHQRYVAQLRVVEALGRESAAQKALDHEKRVEAISGVTNLLAQRAAGESLVSAQEDEQNSWMVYRQNGGNAANPQALTKFGKDPCELH